MNHTFIQARNHGGTQTSVTRIVIHGTVSPCVKGDARNVATDFHTTHRDASAHYVVDPNQIIQCLTVRTIGFHAPPNTGSIGIELCDPQKGGRRRPSRGDRGTGRRSAAGQGLPHPRPDLPAR
jgi:N-acetylmuramoyl-L-alanine amidase CwlA